MVATRELRYSPSVRLVSLRRTMGWRHNGPRGGSDRGVRPEVASLLALEDEIALLKGELSGMGVEKGIETYLIEPGVDTFGLSCKAFWSPKKTGRRST